MCLSSTGNRVSPLRGIHAPRHRHNGGLEARQEIVGESRIVILGLENACPHIKV